MLEGQIVFISWRWHHLFITSYLSHSFPSSSESLLISKPSLFSFFFSGITISGFFTSGSISSSTFLVDFSFSSSSSSLSSSLMAPSFYFLAAFFLSISSFSFVLYSSPSMMYFFLTLCYMIKIYLISSKEFSLKLNSSVLNCRAWTCK